MKIQRLAAAAAAACALFTGGCAIVSSVSQVRDNVFTVDSLGNMGQPGSELLYELYEKGEAYCQEKGMDFKLLNERTNDGSYYGSTQPLAALGSNTSNTFAGGFSRGISAMSVPMGSYGRARIWFTCVQPKPAPQEQEEGQSAPRTESGPTTFYSGRDHYSVWNPDEVLRQDKPDRATFVVTRVFRGASPDGQSQSEKVIYGVLCDGSAFLPLHLMRFSDVFSKKMIYEKKFTYSEPPPLYMLGDDVKEEISGIWREACAR